MLYPPHYRSHVPSETLLLSDDIYQYHYVSQGKIEIPNVNDGQEFVDTNVSTMSEKKELRVSVRQEHIYPPQDMSVY